jgi:hypothetical protein
MPAWGREPARKFFLAADVDITGRSTLTPLVPLPESRCSGRRGDRSSDIVFVLLVLEVLETTPIVLELMERCIGGGAGPGKAPRTTRQKPT